MECIKHFDTVVKERLQGCATAGEMLDVISQEFVLDQKLGIVSHLAFMQGLRAAVTMIKPPCKN